MAKVTGQVYKVYSKIFKGKTNYTVKLDGVDVWYRCGDSNPGNIEGKAVSFTAGEETQSGNSTAAYIKGKIEVLDNSAPPASGPPGKAPSFGKNEPAIHYQNAAGRALTMVQILLASNALKLPTKQAAILEVVEAAVDHYTAQFFEDITTFGAVARANGTTEDAEAPKEKPESEEIEEDEED